MARVIEVKIEKTMNDLTKLNSHFSFGENWSDFLNVVDDARIEESMSGLRRLFPNGELAGATFLDIGCGSGLSSLAAIRLGVGEVTAVDIDPESVDATYRLLSANASGAKWKAIVQSVFDVPDTTHQIVYSWGVLHHTGSMWAAIKSSMKHVSPGGYFAIAIYRKTPMCGAWKVEKAIYSKSPKFVQFAFRMIFVVLNILAILIRGKNPFSYIKQYGGERGMSFSHDVHDWLGGYPYESASPSEIRDFFVAEKFVEERSFVEIPGLGILGSGCDEFVFRKL